MKPVHSPANKMKIFRLCIKKSYFWYRIFNNKEVYEQRICQRQ